MSFTRTKRAFIFKCDSDHCSRQHVAPHADFKKAWDNAKSLGWISAPVTDSVGKPIAWKHYCNWVHRPNVVTA